MTDPVAPGTNVKKAKTAIGGGIAAAAIAGAVAVAGPIAEHFEGYVARARPDPVGIPTYCYGETENVDPMRVYARTECGALLRKRMARDYAPKLLSCVPGFIDPARRYQFGTLLDASYNAGPVAACKSPMARAFNAGRWADGCNAFVGWYETARDRRTGVRVKLRGLVRRRAFERDVCLQGVGQ